MKSKVLAFVLCAILFLSGCGQASVSSSAVEEPAADLPTYPLKSSSKYMAYATSVPDILWTTTAEENGLAGNIYTFSGTVIEKSALETDNGPIEYFIVETDNGPVEVADMYNAYEALMADKGVPELFTLFIEEPDADYSQPEVGETANFICVYTGYSGRLEMPAFYFGANEYMVDGVREPLAESSETPAPTETPEPEAAEESPVSPFFYDDDLRDEYRDALNDLDFDALDTLVATYIEDSAPDADDPIYAVADLTAEALEKLGSCSVDRDDIEDVTTIYYSDINKVTSDTHFIPSLRNADLRILVGFTADDWLFFDSVIVSADGEKVESRDYKSYEVDTDVLDGGRVREQVLIKYSYGEPDLSVMDDAESVIIRFKNKETEEMIDFDLTAEEREAAVTIYRLWQIREELNDYYLEYYHYNPVNG